MVLVYNRNSRGQRVRLWILDDGPELVYQLPSQGELSPFYNITQLTTAVRCAHARKGINIQIPQHLH